jgi:hypothetical protein
MTLIAPFNFGGTSGAPVVGTTSTSFTATIGADQYGDPQITLPPVNTSGTPIPGQATPGDLVVAIAGSVLFQVIDSLGYYYNSINPGGITVYLASPIATWVTLASNVLLSTWYALDPQASGGTVGLGSSNAPSVIASPSAPTGFTPLTLPDGSLGWIPYWK